jgi:hypothetical protein
MKNYTLPKMASRPKSWIRYDPVDCVINRFTYVHATNKLPGNKVSWTHNNCLCNQYIALKFRHQVETPEMLIKKIDMEPLLQISKGVQLAPIGRTKVVYSYMGRWRAKYQYAQQEYHNQGVQSYHSRLTLFPKDDLEMGVPEKAPRAIQFRHPVFMLEQARYTKSIEKWFYTIKDQFNTKIIGKSDPFTIAKILMEKAGNFTDPIFLLLDASKFDSCVDIEWLKFCTEFYLTLFPKIYHRKIRWLWSKTYVNYGSTKQGLKYKTNGTRMSGDMDTGLGNSIIMYTMLISYLARVGISKYSVLVNGDDSIVVIEKKDEIKSQDLTYFKEAGFNMKYEVAYEIGKAEFCQSRLIETDYGYTMARNPYRVMGRTSWTTTARKKKYYRAFINTLGLCERAASWGVPIASVMATKMIKVANTDKQVYLSPWVRENYNNMKKWWKNGEPVISLNTRLSFADAWDISCEEQIRLENSIKVKVLMRPNKQHIDEYDEYVLGQ